MGATDGEPIAYAVLEKRVPVVTRSGLRIGEVEQVLQISAEDVSRGIAITTVRGLRFVDRDQIDQIITTSVTQCDPMLLGCLQMESDFVPSPPPAT